MRRTKPWNGATWTHLMTALLAAAFGMSGCGDEGSGDTVFAGGDGGVDSLGGNGDGDGGPGGSSGSADGGSGGDGDGDGDGDADDGGGGPKFDVGSGNSGGSGGDGGLEDGCQKVDFLFVVDNSVSMGGEQSNLANSFPGFIDTIQSQVAATDYHIMVIDTDDQDKWGEKWNKCHNKCMTDDPGDSCLTTWFDPIICGQEPPEPLACDQTLGAGRNLGAGGPPVPCPVDGGRRYMTDTESDLKGTFQCVAEMGAAGNANERPMEAMLAALGSQTQPGGCHEGFMRDDAVLVVTFISDEEELGSPGDPSSWRNDLLALKGGNETAVVVLALSGDANTAGQECTPTPRMSSFVQSFGSRGFIESICEPNYDPFFQDAVDVIEYACDEYVPAG